MELSQLVTDIADAIAEFDASGTAFKTFHTGAGPFGEPQLVRAVVDRLRERPLYRPGIVTRRTPDVLVTGSWALEVKIARPFGNDGKLAENWSVNLLHPYAGNVSAIGDCLKLESWAGPERRASVVVGYEHTPPQVPLGPLFDSFEAICKTVVGLNIGTRVGVTRPGLVHPVHQQVTVVAWEVKARVP
jgi:hypothetical protein